MKFPFTISALFTISQGSPSDKMELAEWWTKIGPQILQSDNRECAYYFRDEQYSFSSLAIDWKNEESMERCAIYYNENGVVDWSPWSFAFLVNLI